MLRHPDIRIGDTARLPLGRLGDEDVYRHRWTVTAFTRDGLIHVRRLADGYTKTISVAWWNRYTIEDRPAKTRLTSCPTTESAELLRRTRARRLAETRHQTDPSQPGYYVSAVDGSRQKYTLLLGPFADHYSALQLVRHGRDAIRAYTDVDPWISVGTCQIATSDRIGKFNTQVFGA